MTRPRDILVVDDDPTNIDIASFILTRCGHRLASAYNGHDALVLCHDEGRRVDLILLDIAMPRMDGYETLRRLRADERTRDVPILCLSAKASGASEETTLALGADAFLTKPYYRRDLLAAIDATLHKRGRLAAGDSIAG